MNINKVGIDFSIFNKTDKQEKAEKLEENNPFLINKKAENESDPGSKLEIGGNVREGMYNLSPIDRYRFMSGQPTSSNSVNLKVVPGNPQKTLSIANQAINEAILPPIFSNPNRKQLPEAIQMKRIAENLIDQAA